MDASKLCTASRSACRTLRIVTVIGANGAGKTTLLNAIMGVMKGKGSIEFDGKAVADLSLEARVAGGLCLVPERRELFASMPVEDNLLLGGFRRSRAESAQISKRSMRASRG